MKKILLSALTVFTLLFLFNAAVFAANNDSWDEKPVLTQVFELAKGKIFLEWDGKADLYQVYVDGENVSTVNLKYAIVDMKDGVHQIAVIPVDKVTKDDGNNFSLDAKVSGLNQLSKLLGGKVLSSVLPEDFGFGLSLDLGALGIDKKDLLMGNVSDTFRINYKANPIFTAVPEIIDAETDPDERVVLSFRDKYDSDIYNISIKNGSDISSVDFEKDSEESQKFISKDKSTVHIILDPDYLQKQGCLIPELDQKYSFTVKIQKYPGNYVNDTKESSFVHESKESKPYNYTPAAAWKNKPVKISASQTADGQVTLRWTHDDNGVECSYKILKTDMLLGVKKGVETIGETSEKEFVVNDLLNGKYSFSILPFYYEEEGTPSQSVTVEVKNKWSAAPSLKCEVSNKNQVTLKWNAADGIESYHISVFRGDGSLLKFVNLDYKKIEEFDISAESGSMEYVYTYDETIDSEAGVDLKFEIYGSRFTAEGEEQKSASAAQTVHIKP